MRMGLSLMLRLRRRVYLDNNATTEVSVGVRKIMRTVLAECFGNPSSRYRIAREAAEILDQARQNVAEAIGAAPDEIIFTGGASEANNQILKGLLDGLENGRDTVVASPIEHPSVLETLKFLGNQGMRVLFCRVGQDGRVDLEDLSRLIDGRTRLVCCMAANNETGVLQDVAAICRLAHARGALMFADCVQALGKIPLDCHALGLDFASFSAHKIHGPKGVGALFVRTGVTLLPLIHGGHQERGLRAGTEALHNIAGFGRACEAVPATVACSGALSVLRDDLAGALRSALPGAVINTPREFALPNTLSVTLPGFDNGEALAFLDYHGIAASAGSACNTQANEPSHVLMAIGLTEQAARQTLRFSLGERTSVADIRYVGAVFGDYLRGQGTPVTMINPAQLNEDILRNENLFILDVRNALDRKFLKGLPGSHEAPLLSLKKYLDQIPPRREILVACQGGTDGPIVAYYLRSKGYRHVSFVMGGVVAWKIWQPDLYTRLGGTGIRVLEPGKKTA